jgi:hypothetical protein
MLRRQIDIGTPGADQLGLELDALTLEPGELAAEPRNEVSMASPLRHDRHQAPAQELDRLADQQTSLHEPIYSRRDRSFVTEDPSMFSA